MSRIWFIVLVSAIVSSCYKMPKDDYVSPLNVPKDFDWKTIETRKIMLTQVSSILNEEGDTVASFIPAGEYGITVGKGAVLKIVGTAQAQTKAVSGNVKEVIYFPAQNKYATVMFEDLFPNKGDMDMNDLVFGLNIEYLLDNQARVVGIRINIQPRALGSSYMVIGLAANLSSTAPIDIVNTISHSASPALGNMFSVTTYKDGYSPELNNTSSQVIPLSGSFRSYFDNQRDLFLNVRNIDEVTATQDFSVLIELKSNEKFPYSDLTFLDTLRNGKINLDIFATFGTRGREVHFKGQKPTDHFNYQHFITTYPKSDFSTFDNWVWAILSDKSIRHQLEFVKIYHSYPSFQAWAEGGGVIGAIWYIPSVTDSLYTRADFNYIN